MMNKGCIFPGCGRDHYGNDLCEAHNRQKTRGKELAPIKPLTPAQKERQRKLKKLPEDVVLPQRKLKKGQDSMRSIVQAIDHDLATTALSDELLDRMRAILARWNALDLADMLGVSQKDTK